MTHRGVLISVVGGPFKIGALLEISSNTLSLGVALGVLRHRESVKHTFFRN